MTAVRVRRLTPGRTAGRAFVNRLLRLPRRVRRTMVLLVYLSLAVGSSYLAFNLRFDGAVPEGVLTMFLGTVPWLLAARASTFIWFRLDEGMWRYVGLWDLRRIALAIATSSLVFYAFVRWGYGTDDYPRSIFMIDSALLLILMSAFRLSPRIIRELRRPTGGRRLLIVGAGDAGERLLRELQHNHESDYQPIGFVDDDPAQTGQRMHGVPVLGTLGDLQGIMKRRAPQEVMLAMPGVEASLLRSIVTSLEPFDVPISTFIGKKRGGSGVGEIRQLSIEDLLSRPPVGLNADHVRRLIAGKRVLVTGAGGSIGSELCRQVAEFGPESLVLYERYENGLYAIANTLKDADHPCVVHPVIGDVTDSGRLNAVFNAHRPDIVFHAAAHKHVPLMEANPCEAVKNNVGGTRLTAEAALRHGVQRFILISTDKAVNPSSVMGTTKRVAELIVQGMAERGSTRFVTVRFGNVLGSNGSVLPRFQEQVKAGGPVTVTHPEMTRFFMLIPEAVQLVLHAAAAGDRGDTLVLDMGAQIRVLDLAKNVIRLSGHAPDREIPIVFTGLRPGEKLVEELAGAGERIEPGKVDKILRVVAERPAETDAVIHDLAELERCAVAGEQDLVMHLLTQLVPAFQPEKRFAAPRKAGVVNVGFQTT